MKKCLFSILFFTFSICFLAAQELKIDDANKLLEQGDYSAALRAYTGILNKNPKDIGALLGRGLTYLYIEMSDSAIADFSRIITISPKFADAFNNRGLAYSYKEEIDSAFNDFSKAIELDSDFAEAYLNRAGIYLHIEKNDEAFEDLSKAIKLNPKNPETYMQRARLFHKKNDFENAIKDFSKAIENGIKNDEVYYLRANAYFKLEKYEKSIDDYTFALKLNSNNSNALNNRAIAFDMIGDSLNANFDRQQIENIHLNFFNVPDLSSLHYKKFFNADSSIVITLPEGWFQIEDQFQDLKRMIISQDSLSQDGNSFFIGAEFYSYYNMEKNYGVQEKEEILEFWKGSTAKNAMDYATYSIQSQKMFKRNEFSGLLNKVFMQANSNQPLTYLTELVLAKDDFLFFAYFQVPDAIYKYYEEIVEKAIDSLIIK